MEIVLEQREEKKNENFGDLLAMKKKKPKSNFTFWGFLERRPAQAEQVHRIEQGFPEWTHPSDSTSKGMLMKGNSALINS